MSAIVKLKHGKSTPFFLSLALFILSTHSEIIAANLFPYTNPSISSNIAKIPSKVDHVVIDYGNLILFELSIDDEPPKPNSSIAVSALSLSNASDATTNMPTEVPNFTNNNSMMNEAELNILQDQLSKMKQQLSTQDASFFTNLGSPITQYDTFSTTFTSTSDPEINNASDPNFLQQLKGNIQQRFNAFNFG